MIHSLCGSCMGLLSICVVHYIQGPLYLYMGSSSFNFIDTKKEICPYTFKNMIYLPSEISNEWDVIKGRIHELLYNGFL